MFINSNGKGFGMTFENGNTVSVQWGYGNYCENKFENREEIFGKREVNLGEWQLKCKDAEVAAWDAEGNWYSWGWDDVKGYNSPDFVAQFIHFVATSNLQEEVFEWEDKTMQGEDQ